MKNSIQPQLRNQDKSGFTLTELLLAAGLTTMTILLGGWAVSHTTQASKANSSQSERKIELNRAQDFIASEIRQASGINLDNAPASFSPPTTEIASGSYQDVLRLRIQGTTQPVIYYLANPASSNQTWRGPKVLYRWGPPFNGNGYDLTASWVHQPLIDALEDTASTVSCPLNWTQSPTTNVTSFYACVDPSGKIAQLYNKGRVTKSLGQTTPYLAESQAFTRGATLPFDIKDCSGNVISGTGGGCQITLTQPSNTQVRVLGSDIRCGASGTPVKTNATVRITRPEESTISESKDVDPNTLAEPFTYSNQPVGTTFDFTGKVIPQSENNPDNTCNLDVPAGSSGFNSISHPLQVKVLRHGDQVPANQAFGTGKSVKDYLDGYIDNTGRVNLPKPESQSVVVFELWSRDPNQSAYDLQDLVLLVEINPLS
jgi:type II secretory pathway pseudopilin PulG